MPLVPISVKFADADLAVAYRDLLHHCTVRFGTGQVTEILNVDARPCSKMDACIAIVKHVTHVPS